MGDEITASNQESRGRKKISSNLVPKRFSKGLGRKHAASKRITIKR